MRSRLQSLANRLVALMDCIQCMPSDFMPVVIGLRPSVKVTIPWDKPKGIQCMPSGFTPVVIDLRPSMKVMIPWDKPSCIRCMPSGFMPVVIDLRPSVKVTIPWDKPKGIQCMPSGFTPVVIDLRPSVKVTIPSLRSGARVASSDGVTFIDDALRCLPFSPGQATHEETARATGCLIVVGLVDRVSAPEHAIPSRTYNCDVESQSRFPIKNYDRSYVDGISS